MEKRGGRIRGRGGEDTAGWPCSGSRGRYLLSDLRTLKDVFPSDREVRKSSLECGKKEKRGGIKGGMGWGGRGGRSRKLRGVECWNDAIYRYAGRAKEGVTTDM